MERAESTVCGYLQDFIRHEQITDPSPWVDAETIGRIQEAIVITLEEELAEALRNSVTDPCRTWPTLHGWLENDLRDEGTRLAVHRRPLNI